MLGSLVPCFCNSHVPGFIVIVSTHRLLPYPLIYFPRSECSEYSEYQDRYFSERADSGCHYEDPYLTS